MHLTATSSSAISTKSMQDNDWYIVQCDEWETHYTREFAKLKWGSPLRYFEEIKELLYYSPVYYYSFFCGLYEDWKEVAKARKGVNRRLLLEELGRERCERITRQYRKNKNYVAAL